MGAERSEVMQQLVLLLKRLRVENPAAFREYAAQIRTLYRAVERKSTE